MAGVFISYRRDDTAGYAGRLYDALSARFRKKLVFIDVDSIPAGDDFVEVVEKRIASCSVVLVLIGKAWLNSRDDRGNRRLDHPNDFVRLEIASALRQNKEVIPVLVGGARMPHASDLPAPLASLAHRNAVEIFDTLFRDSTRHLIEAIEPFVAPKSVWRRWLAEFKEKPALSALALMFFGALLIVGATLKPKPKPYPGAYQAPTLTAETLAEDPPAGSTIHVKVKTPVDVEDLPPIVTAAKSVMMPGGSTQVTGPAEPHVLWRANVTIGDAWNVIGIAADGTVYLYDRENGVVDAIRDGKEQWAYSTPGPLGFDSDGRLWLGEYAFNSRGEGGRVMKKSLLPNPSVLQNDRPHRQFTYDCRDGKVFAMDSKGKKPWEIDLDGNCGNPEPAFDPLTGNIYASSDARTLYAIAGDGRVLWDEKQACKDSSVAVYPIPDNEVIVACDHEPLYLLRDGKKLWASTMEVTSGNTWSEAVFDGSGNIYAGAEETSPFPDLRSFDKNGKQRWKISTGTIRKASPIGFDVQGRLYVSVGEQLVSLSR